MFSLLLDDRCARSPRPRAREEYDLVTILDAPFDSAERAEWERDRVTSAPEVEQAGQSEFWSGDDVGDYGVEL